MDQLHIAGVVLALTLIVLSNIPVFSSFFRHHKSSDSQRDGYYCDEDGEATESSLKALDDKWIRGSIFGFSLIGLSCAATVVVATIRKSDEAALPMLWCQFAGWILSSLQSLVFFTETSVTRRFAVARCAFWTSMGLIALATTNKSFSWSDQDTAIYASQISICGAAAVRAVCCLLVPRRPDVFYQGKIVDQERTVCLWSRFTFGYITSLVRFIGRNQSTMVIEDFPQLPYQARSENLHGELRRAQQKTGSLFQALCKVHSRALIRQVILSLGSGLLSFGPSIALYGILRGLEDQSSIGSLGVWVAALGATMFLSSSLNSWLWCITYSQLAIPIYSELLALLYAKSMRRKDVLQLKSVIGDMDESPKSRLEPGKEETINLVTVDTKRVSDYVSYNHLIPSSVTQLIIACGVLHRLIGWQSLVAGLAANLLGSPVNLLIAKKYRLFQIDLMQARDQRTAIVHEVTKNIRQIKFSSLEPAWQDRVLGARQLEMRLNLKALFFETGFKAIWTLAPLLLSVVSLTVYAIQNGHLEASVAFTAISIFGSLEVALAALPHLISSALEAKISVDRINHYLGVSEKALSPENAEESIVFQDATIAWPISESIKEGGFRLSGLSFEFPPKGLTVVTGRTGSGKSLLLSSILGECDIVSGSIQVPSCSQELWKEAPSSKSDWIIDSAVAYVAQNSWTENGTIRDNILFGLPLDRIRYRDVLFASGLERDLDILADGDQTDIGANGINLSGGQRLRVSFARALYSRAGILIMDDIFAALDTDTSHHVYEYGLTGNLAQDRTRILATHSLGLCLPRTDYCVTLADGSTSCAGSVAELRKTDVFTEVLRHGHHQSDNNGRGSQSPRQSGRVLNDDTLEGQIFSPEELRATGSVPLKLYKKFITAEKSLWMWLLGMMASLLYTVSLLGRSWWLNVWTGADEAKISHYPNYPLIALNFATHLVQKVDTTEELFLYIGIYVGISFVASLMGTFRFLFIRIASLRSSQALFKSLLSAVLAAPLRWIDTVPLGRILNRFTSDIYTLDYLLGSDLADFSLWILQICGVLLASVSVSPIILVPASILLAASIKLSTVYLAAAREVKRLESISKTPILEQFTSSLLGLTTIRAFDQTNKYIESMLARIDGYSKLSRNLWLLNWWLQLRINVLGAIFSTIVAFLVVKLGVSASLAGFAISFLLQYSTAISSMIRFYASFEMDMNATERVIDYASIETESQCGLDPPAAWPTRGHMIVENLVVSYSPELPPVLKGLTFTIESNQRVGVVGRTGSGKSTLALALFRFMEASQGQIFIDGLDTSKLKLHALRRALAIVPQLPTLFTGTIRSNLDPLDSYPEIELNDVLERVHLVSPNNSSTARFSLDTRVSEGGTNFSQGERQLLCLARAILLQPKIMILDEATSSVDMETDGHIQQAIRSEFGRNMSSLLVVAHRLSTIADFDRILVMHEGRIVESGSPRELICIKGGFFHDLINQSNEKALLENIIWDHGLHDSHNGHFM